jgi:hypothetical protein
MHFCTQENYMLRMTALICLLLLASVHAQDSNFQRWMLVTPPETVSVSDAQFGDVEVLQDGRAPKQGRPAIQQEVPFRIGLVFDESGSGRSLPSHDALLEHVLGWAGDTQRRKGDAFLVGFNDQIVTSTEITADISQLRHALSQLRPFGGSAVRDAIIHSAQKFDSVRQESQPVARLLVLVTDGHDNASYAKERGVIGPWRGPASECTSLGCRLAEHLTGRVSWNTYQVTQEGRHFSPLTRTIWIGP